MEYLNDILQIMILMSLILGTILYTGSFACNTQYMEKIMHETQYFSELAKYIIIVYLTWTKIETSN
jgi:hypothetical protein